MEFEEEVGNTNFHVFYFYLVTGVDFRYFFTRVNCDLTTLYIGMPNISPRLSLSVGPRACIQIWSMSVKRLVLKHGSYFTDYPSIRWHAVVSWLSTKTRKAFTQKLEKEEIKKLHLCLRNSSLLEVYLLRLYFTVSLLRLISRSRAASTALFHHSLSSFSFFLRT